MTREYEALKSALQIEAIPGFIRNFYLLLECYLQLIAPSYALPWLFISQLGTFHIQSTRLPSHVTSMMKQPRTLLNKHHAQLLRRLHYRPIILTPHRTRYILNPTPRTPIHVIHKRKERITAHRHVLQFI